VGIGGCGLSGLARLLAESGATVSGSDSVAGELTEALRRDGIPVSHRQDALALPGDAEVVIASAAIGRDHPELLEAARRGLPVLTYAEALGLVQARYTTVCVSGTHGKSTTAAMLSHVLLHAGLDPSVVVGASCPQIGGGSRTGAPRIAHGPLAGQPGILVAEACEFRRSFHEHRPRLAVITSIEEDHLDVYESLDAIVEAFSIFARRIPPAEDGGRLLIAHTGAFRERVAEGLRCAVETYGFDPGASWVVRHDAGTGRVELLRGGETVARWTNHMAGAHNALDAAAAGILAWRLGASWEEVAEALGSFRGLKRRMERLGVRSLPGGGIVTVYDDYGHHPTEVAVTLAALRAAERPRRLICVFQPHQHSRTRFLLDRFARSFSSADLVIVPHIYFVRDPESEKHRVSAADLVDRLRESGAPAMHVYPFAAVVEQLQLTCRDGDLLVVMGAGPVWQVARSFLAGGPPGG
jgi:UDP-N-acetylmuramate--alanine ligase